MRECVENGKNKISKGTLRSNYKHLYISPVVIVQTRSWKLFIFSFGPIASHVLLCTMFVFCRRMNYYITARCADGEKKTEKSSQPNLLV